MMNCDPDTECPQGQDGKENKMDKKKRETILIVLMFIIASIIVVMLVVPSLRSQVQQFVGLAVAQDALIWNRLKDGVAGDNLANGVGAMQMYLYDNVGGNFDRAYGDTTSGMWVNVKAFASTAVVPVYTTLSSTITSGQVTVDTTAGGVVIKAANTSRRSIIVRNQGATDMYVGPTPVTTANGILVKIDEVLVLDRTTAAIYGITAAGSTTAGYLEE